MTDRHPTDDPELDAVPADAEDEEEAGLYEHFAVTADKGQTPMRLDKFLTVRMEHCSRNRIQAAADSGNILVNGKAAKSSYKVKPLDRIQIVMPYPRREVELVAEDIPLDIPYEDQWLLLVDKPAGLVVHPGVGNYSGTLVNALMHHLNKQGIPAEEQNRAGLVHRIDKNTSGLLVIAKDEQTHARLAKQFFDHTIQRRYVALVWGNFDEDEGTITGNIGRSPKDRQKMFVFADGSDGKHAVTHWKVLKRYGYVTLVECRLETGRTHQIRVHMAWIGHPLFNDERYGGDRILKGTTFAKYRQFIENCFAVMPRHFPHTKRFRPIQHCQQFQCIIAHPGQIFCEHLLQYLIIHRIQLFFLMDSLSAIEQKHHGKWKCCCQKYSCQKHFYIIFHTKSTSSHCMKRGACIYRRICCYLFCFFR